MTQASPARQQKLVHPVVVRTWHWLNALAVIVMLMSGWRIYDNVPIIPGFTFPIWMTLGGDPDLSYKTSGDAGFANALLWHFAGMWLLTLNNLAYLIYGFATRRFQRRLFPISPRQLLRDIGLSLRLKLDHDDLSRYNAVQRTMYVGVLVLLVVMVLSGLAIWKPVQLQVLTSLFGGFQGSRIVHFIAMSLIAAFIVVHVTLALLVPRTLLSMFTGRVPAPLPASSEVPR